MEYQLRLKKLLSLKYQKKKQTLVLLNKNGHQRKTIVTNLDPPKRTDRYQTVFQFTYVLHGSSK